jgi:hypothetical protein
LPDPHRLNNPTGKLPKVPFPRFDGDNPCHWRTCAKKYFKMYFMEPYLWINISEMHFDGAAPFGTGLCKFLIDHGMISVLKFMTVLIAIGMSPYSQTIPCDTNLHSLQLSISIH